MSEPNYYAVLGVRRGADPAEIRHAYVERLKNAHPDVEQRSAYPQAGLEDLQRAYHVLRDADTRSAHDAALLAAEMAHASRLRRVQRRLGAANTARSKTSRGWLRRPTRISRSQWRLLLIAAVIVIGRELIVHG